jgi:hypothetical protein
MYICPTYTGAGRTWGVKGQAGIAPLFERSDDGVIEAVRRAKPVNEQHSQSCCCLICDGIPFVVQIMPVIGIGKERHGGVVGCAKTRHLEMRRIRKLSSSPEKTVAFEHTE